MSSDLWAGLADRFVDGAYATTKGRVRTFVLHQHLRAHLPAAPARVLDVGGGAGHQSFPLARAGYHVTLLDASPAMLAKASQRLAEEPAEVRDRVRLVPGRGEDAVRLVAGQRFAAVLCHGVLMYVEDPAPLLAALCECTEAGGIVSILALNADTLAVRPALEHRWADALAAFDARGERGVLGVDTRADTVEELTEQLRGHGVAPLARYGAWLFSDWMDLDTPVGPSDGAPTGVDLDAVAAVELEASRRDPYRGMSRVFHLLGRRAN